MKMDVKQFRNADESIKVRSLGQGRVGPPYEFLNETSGTWQPVNRDSINAFLNSGNCIYWNPA